DDDIPVNKTLEAMGEAGLDHGRIGLEKRSSFLPYSIAEGIVKGAPKVEWIEASDLVNDCRLVQSPLELECTRRAATLTDSMMLSAIAAAGPDVSEREIMAAVYDAMFRRGGTYPGFVPLIRSTRTIEHEHGTWTDGALAARDVLFVELAGCVRRYHAPAGRLVFIGEATEGADRIQQICEGAMMKAAEAIGPGVKATEVYQAWQDYVDAAGLAGYRRHHCGYAVGIGFPPSWSGSGTPRGLRRGSQMKLESGMVFHLMSWMLRTGQGDSFLSDTIVVTDDGCELLTNAPRTVVVR
ncbi:MAG TPA: Xaa-Pro peptidase family protein, partial [Kofleriaceae bacterium]|nr:Xaa-Pro peptidase family protein [Kofleriaceae bacterium]